ncbi:hypothetical protein [Sporomusa acidovorans]|uniref:Uncharacterized protein n=1 Tax=Sporomusa acidovorans (strain ATCC 49682 / DSM 3132 / Mol) TaxID=1123286 RepID=A0ABZ3J0F0_SPOA4|nr:hypothetical protein [Sporomusa acidovorans]OZC17322.1 hypothetical protein SPACI_38570 [Sporomusa acidovorans DSM 3132]SDF84907.1 hypothetical protein SAMN04488499_11011 [Sporomusa acidovorans]
MMITRIISAPRSNTVALLVRRIVPGQENFANYPFGLLTVPVNQVIRLQPTSDLRGVVGFTQQDISNQNEMIAQFSRL